MHILRDLFWLYLGYVHDDDIIQIKNLNDIDRP